MTHRTDDQAHENTAPDRDDLPLPDYDHLPVGTLAHRVRQLDADGLEKVIAYERAHGRRVPVLTVLEQRLEELRAGAEPSGGDPDAGSAPDGTRRGGKATPQTAAEPSPPERYQRTSSHPRG
ncbi:hypothetical protein GCM10009718_10960 [Isoptericola halotolerans]|uniref:DUF8129 domain-containing protein n=1 Tax=Isoptericola halotolerans TaxID=300560 RepID=A0ABX1ZZF9_9MICO|nr:hypothetical protein [Isoptericola halotolerans]NOV95982.1 hypothetical protein [Isoptericola halotolerans]